AMRSRWRRAGIPGIVLLQLLVATARAQEPPGAMPVSLAADPTGSWIAIIAPDGKTLATAGDRGILKLWDLDSKRERRISPASTARFTAAAFSPDGKTLVAGRNSGELVVWAVSSTRMLRSVKEHSATVRALTFTPDGKHLVSSGQDGKLLVWDVVT